MNMTVKVLALSVSISLGSFTLANDHEHREHGAHVHGSATLEIAFDNVQGKIEFKAASEGLLGFEHEATSEKEKKTLADITARFEKEIQKMIQFDATLGCSISKDKIGMIKSSSPTKDTTKKGTKVVQGEHSDFTASYNVTCSRSIVGSKLKIDFTHFSKVKNLDITVLAGDLQKTAETKGKSITIDMKR